MRERNGAGSAPANSIDPAALCRAEQRSRSCDRIGSRTSYQGGQDWSLLEACHPIHQGRRVVRGWLGHRATIPASRRISPYRSRRLPLPSPTRPTISPPSKSRGRRDKSRSETELALGPPGQRGSSEELPDFGLDNGVHLTEQSSIRLDQLVRSSRSSRRDSSFGIETKRLTW